MHSLTRKTGVPVYYARMAESSRDTFNYGQCEISAANFKDPLLSVRKSFPVVQDPEKYRQSILLLFLLR